MSLRYSLPHLPHNKTKQWHGALISPSLWDLKFGIKNVSKGIFKSSTLRQSFDPRLCHFWGASVTNPLLLPSYERKMRKRHKQHNVRYGLDAPIKIRKVMVVLFHLIHFIWLAHLIIFWGSNRWPRIKVWFFAPKNIKKYSWQNAKSNTCFSWYVWNEISKLIKVPVNPWFLMKKLALVSKWYGELWWEKKGLENKHVWSIWP